MIAIIDYGAGNLGSVEKAFNFLGLDVVLTNDKEIIFNADAVVLPGVGAFADVMENMRSSQMDKVILKVISDKKPFLGICLGMQMMFEYSEEGGDKIPGLGVFKGAIKRFPDNMNLKVPHMGWNLLNPKKQCRLFNNLGDNLYVYFVHSYYLDASDKSIVAATSQYGIEFDAAVNYENVYLTQFHPEKSGETGLSILKNFAAIV